MTNQEALVRAEEINKIACSKCDMPDGLSMSEKLLFLALRSLYYQYSQGFIKREQATVEKNQLLKQYTNNQMWEDIFCDDVKIHNAINKLTAPLGSKISEMVEQEAKDTLIKVIKLYDGRLSPEEV